MPQRCHLTNLISRFQCVNPASCHFSAPRSSGQPGDSRDTRNMNKSKGTVHLAVGHPAYGSSFVLARASVYNASHVYQRALMFCHGHCSRHCDSHSGCLEANSAMAVIEKPRQLCMESAFGRYILSPRSSSDCWCYDCHGIRYVLVVAHTIRSLSWAHSHFQVLQEELLADIMILSMFRAGSTALHQLWNCWRR